MTEENQYARNFDFTRAYEFLRENGLGSVAEEIQISRDQFKSYTTTLKRAKIIKVVTDAGLIDKFIDKVWQSGKTRRGQTRIHFWLDNVYAGFKHQADEIEDDEELQDSDEAESVEERQFAAERDLHNYLVTNLAKIEPGLRLYQGEDGISGNEFPVGGRRVDILAIDRAGVPVIIELKVSRGHERVVGQVLYYEAMVKRLLHVDRIRIIIVANQISEELRLASETLKNVELFQYQISMELASIPK